MSGYEVDPHLPLRTRLDVFVDHLRREIEAAPTERAELILEISNRLRAVVAGEMGEQHAVIVEMTIVEALILAQISSTVRAAIGPTALICPNCGASASLPLEMTCADHRPVMTPVDADGRPR